ncbi:hypothetical protein [Luteococcus sediminum]
MASATATIAGAGDAVFQERDRSTRANADADTSKIGAPPSASWRVRWLAASTM